jgi:hypothetical protein
VEERFLQFQEHYERISEPLELKFKREDLRKMQKRLSKKSEEFAFSA